MICQADKGTLFLDEIGELDPQGQAKLLRVIETKDVFAVGSGRGRRCDVRFVAATNRDLSPDSDGPLREDLFYRLCVGHIYVPPLRGCHGQILALIDLFVQDQNRCQNRNVVGFDKGAEQLLVSYDWPGNVRELRNMVEATFVNAEGPVFGVDDIPVYHNARLTRSAGDLKADAAKLLAALKASNGNKALAACYLRCSRTTVYRQLNRISKNCD